VNLAPIVHAYPLRCPARHAFDVYVGRIGEWWDPRYTPDAAAFLGATIEPRVDGRVYFTMRDGEHEWGRVRRWEPGRRLVHSFTLAQPANTPPSELAVTFADDGTGCTLHFEHRGWTAANAADRHKFSDWRIMLDRFAALAQG